MSPSFLFSAQKNFAFGLKNKQLAHIDEKKKIYSFEFGLVVKSYSLILKNLE